MLTHRFSRAALFVALLAVASQPIASIQQQSAQPPASPKPAAPQQAAPTVLHGVRNFTSVDSTFACGGALAEGAMPALKEAGFVTVVNLRAATEDGANVEAEMAAARKAGINYVHLPFVTATPDGTKVDEFLKIAAEPANQPVLLHCTSGGRASMFWAIKRVLVDCWTVEKAMAELPELSKNASAALKTFTLEYLKAHGKNSRQ
jgi:uncharacterized protein (TIGR01244 family)